MPRPKTTRSNFRTLAAHLQQAAANKRVVGFDVFDTLLRRRVSPEHIKDQVAKRMCTLLAEQGINRDCSFIRHLRAQTERQLGEQAEANGYDHEFRLPELLHIWIAKVAPRARADLADELLAHERELERRAVYPTPHIRETLEQLANSGKRLIFVTDMYLGLATVRDLLASAGLLGYFQYGYCSAENLRTKRSGRLFARVLESEQIAPEDMLFVGDNQHSDVDPAAAQGIDTLHIVDKGEQRRRNGLDLCRTLAAKNPIWHGRTFRRVMNDAPRRIRTDGGSEYELGLMLAPVFIAFVRYVIDQAAEQGIQRLFFASREGLTFLRLYRRVLRALDIQDAPPAHYFACSRRSTFLASQDEFSVAGLERLLRQYDNQPLKRLLRNLSLPVEEFAPLAQRCGFESVDEIIAEPETHTAFQAFLADSEVQQRFRVHRDAARQNLRQYLAQQGFFDVERVGLVDIGWKGTIQDNVVRAVRTHAKAPEIHGLYFGLVHIADDDVERSFKHGYMADTRRGDLLEETVFKNGPVFEMFSSAQHPGVVAYGPHPRIAGRIKPIAKSDDHERRDFHKVAAEVFTGIDDYVEDYLYLAPLIGSSASAWRADLLDQLRRYILYPTYAEAKRFLRYSHVESFGVFHRSTYEFKGDWREIVFGGSPLKMPKRLIQTLERQFWPEGFLRRTGVPFANVAYDLLETRYGCRRIPD